MRVLAYFPWLVGLLGILAGPYAAAQPAEPVQIFLIQNSGWMEPFLNARNIGDFRAFLQGMIVALATPDEAGQPRRSIVIASFNQQGQVEGRTSPQELGRGPGTPEMIAAALAKLDLPHKTGSPALADSDFDGAMNGALEMLDGQPGIVWMVTNNLPSPNNDQNVGLYNRRFVERMRDEADVLGVVSNPVPMFMRGDAYPDGLSGFVVYGFAYRSALAEQRMRDWAERAGVAVGPRFGRLKPLDRQPLEFEVERVRSVRGSNVRGHKDTGPDGLPILVITDLAPGEELTVELNGTLKSSYYPLVIGPGAALAGTWTDRTGDNARSFPERVLVHLSAEKIDHAVRPGDEILPKFSATITVPGFIVPSEPAQLYMGGEVREGALELKLTGMDVEQIEDFQERSRNIFFERRGTVNVSAIEAWRVYLDYKQVKEATYVFPMRFVLSRPTWPGALTIALFAAAGLGVAALCAAWKYRPRKVFPVEVGDTVQDVALRVGDSRIVASPDGGTRVKASRSMLGRLTVEPLPPRQYS